MLITNHEVFGYFADRYGFEVAGAIIPSGSTLDGTSAGDLAELAELITDEGVPASSPTSLRQISLPRPLPTRSAATSRSWNSSPNPWATATPKAPPTSTWCAPTPLESLRLWHPDRVIEFFTEAFEPTFMQRALLASLVAVVATSVIGTWVVLRGLSFLGDALAHGVIPGIALAVLWGFSPVVARSCRPS